MDGEVQRLIQEYRQAKEAWELRKRHTQASQGERLDPFCTYYKRNYVGFDEIIPEDQSFKGRVNRQCNSQLPSEVDPGCSTGISVALPVQSAQRRAQINIVPTSPQAELDSAQGEMYNSSMDTEAGGQGETLNSAGGGVGVGTAASRPSEPGNSADVIENKVATSSSYSQDRDSPNESDAHPTCDHTVSQGQPEEPSDSDHNTPRLSEGSAAQSDVGNGGDAENAEQHSKWWRWFSMS